MILLILKLIKQLTRYKFNNYNKYIRYNIFIHLNITFLALKMEELILILIKSFMNKLKKINKSINRKKNISAHIN